MKSWLPSSLLLSLFVLLAPADTNAQCARTNVRQEIRQLSPTQLSRYLAAVNKLNTGAWPTPYDQMVWRHISAAPVNHGYPPFFPWHRVFVSHYESLLQAIDPSVTVPYWDITLDARAPQTSIVFANDHFGGRGTGPNCRLLVGPFANKVCYYSSDPNLGAHYLRRCFNRGAQGISPFYSPEVMSNIVNSANTYDQLRVNVESAPHGTVHVGVGGAQGDMSVMMSTNDPLFFSLHAYMDMVWDRWQRSSSSHFRSYGGTNRDGSTARTTDRLASYSSWTVAQTFDVTASPMCVAYADDSNLHSTTVSTVAGLTKRADIKLQDLQLLGVPDPLPESYIKMMNFNSSVVRQVEGDLCGFIRKCNKKINLVKNAIDQSYQAIVNGSTDAIDELQNQIGAEIGHKLDLKDLAHQVASAIGSKPDSNRKLSLNGAENAVDKYISKVKGADLGVTP